MKESKENIRKFIDKISEIQHNQADKGLTEKELKEIAFEMGMTGEEWLKVEKAFNDNLTRGKGFLDYENWDDALYEFQQAGTIKPDHFEVLWGLARVYRGFWISKGDKKDRERSEDYAKKCIRIDPGHKGALELISSLKKSEQKKSPVVGFVITGVVIAVILFGVVSFILLLPQKNVVLENLENVEDQGGESFFFTTTLTLNDMLVPYITSINRHSQRIYQSYNRYLSWIVDPDSGPVGGTGSIYGLYDIYDSDEHIKNIEQMNNKVDEYPVLGIKGLDYIKAFENLKPILSEALDYYEMENYRDDDFKKGQELHAPLVFAFKNYIIADRALRSKIEELQVDVNNQVNNSLSNKSKSSKEYQLLHLAGVAYNATKEAIILDKNTKNMKAFLSALTVYEEAFKEFSNLVEIHEKEWGINWTYTKNYKELAQIFVYFRRAAEKGNTRERYRTGTVYNQLVDDYNRTVETCNYEIRYKFDAALKYLWLKIPLELIHPVD